MIDSLKGTYKLNDGKQIPGIGLGVFRVEDGQEIYDNVREALDIGYRHIDTAALYHNEAGVGKAIRESGVPREDVFLTTKLWPLDFERTQDAFDESFKKLGTEYIDLYLLHWPGVNEDLRYRAWDTLLELREKGLIKSAGVSNFMAHHLEHMIEKTGVVPVNNQIELHPWHQQREVCRYCRANNITITAWGPIFHGHLAEEPLMTELGEKYGKSPAQVTLRWHIQNGIIIIPKSSKKERLIENTELFDFEIQPDDMERINALDGKKQLGFDPLVFDGDLRGIK